MPCIRLVSEPKFASGLISAFPKIIQQEGVMKGFYAGFGPILSPHRKRSEPWDRKFHTTQCEEEMVAMLRN